MNKDVEGLFKIDHIKIQYKNLENKYNILVLQWMMLLKKHNNMILTYNSIFLITNQ